MEAAYFAGIVDGEGCVFFPRKNGRSVRVSVANTSGVLIEWLRGIGGSVIVGKSRFAQPRKSTKVIFSWQVNSWRNCLDVLRQIEPYMLIKRDRAALAIASIRDWMSEGKKSHKIHCRHGHLFTPINTAFDRDGAQVCRACGRDRMRRSRSRRTVSHE